MYSKKANFDATLSSVQVYCMFILCPAVCHSVAGQQCIRTSMALTSIHGQEPYSVPKVSSVEHSGLRSQRIVTCQQPIQMNRLRVALCQWYWDGGGHSAGVLKLVLCLNIAGIDWGAWLHERSGVLGQAVQRSGRSETVDVFKQQKFYMYLLVTDTFGKIVSTESTVISIL